MPLCKWVGVTLFLSFYQLGLRVIAKVESPGEKFIVSGDPVKIEEMPYVVSILIAIDWPNNLIICSGSILSNRWVLSTGHCFEDLSVRDGHIKIRAGVDDYSQEGPVIDVKRIVYPRLGTLFIDRDICLLQTFDEIPFSDRVQPVGLPLADEKVESITKVRVAGWGEGGDFILELAASLTAVDLEILELRVCSKYYDYDYRHPETGSIFCAGKDFDPPISTCSGDTGSGGVIRRSDNKTWVIMGVERRNRCRGRTLFVSVPHHITWINKQMRQYS